MSAIVVVEKAFTDMERAIIATFGVREKWKRRMLQVQVQVQVQARFITYSPGKPCGHHLVCVFVTLN